MKALFGIVALLIVVGVTVSLAKQQMRAVGGGAATALPVATVARPNAATMPEQARALQEQARAETARALEQGAERNRRADL